MFYRFGYRFVLLCGLTFFTALPSFSQTASQADRVEDASVKYSYGELSRLIVYPELARRDTIEGRVVVDVLVDTVGRGVDTRIVEGRHPLLDSAAVVALRKLNFTPALSGTKPVMAWVQVPIDFAIPSPFSGVDGAIPMEVEPKYSKIELARNLVYPREAIRDEIEGKVIVRVQLDKEGEIINTLIDESVHPLLDSAAVRAVHKIRFTPATQNGVLIPIWLQIPVVFQLTSDTKQDSARSAPIIETSVPVYQEASYSREELATKLVYPEAARILNVQGTVRVGVKVGTSGEVLAIRIDKCDHELLCAAARDAVATLTFRPATRFEKPVAEWLEVPVEFRLK